VALESQVDEHTGLGAWLPIAAEEVREREERQQQRAAEAALEEAQGPLAGRKRRACDATSSSAHAFAAEGEEEGDAYAALNPYGGKYRGIDLEGGEEAGEEAAAPAGGGAAASAASRPTRVLVRPLGAGTVAAAGTGSASADAVAAGATVVPAQVLPEFASQQAAPTVFKQRALKPGQRIRKSKAGLDDD
jgi:hypothetical protein